MTTKVRFLGWSTGLEKVRLSKLIREITNIPLNEAHEAVNRLLAGKTVDLLAPSEQSARQLAQEAGTLGVRAECVDMEVTAKQ
jgi:hypothetical protein